MKTDVPVAALRLNGIVELGDNGEESKTAPFRMQARSGGPIDHWYWGRIVHDFAGMNHKNRIPIDYVHQENEIVGYGNKFDHSSGDLVIEGALVPFKDSDRATEIIHKNKLGVPYEASITFDDAAIEDIAEGQTVEVNGRAFSGPGVVVREWTLRGVAVCPYGYDSNTETTALAESKTTKTVKVLNMPEDVKEEIENTPQASEDVSATAETTVDEGDVAETDSAESAEVVADVEAQTDEPETVKLSQGQRFLEAFGERGCVWFVEGKTFEEAQTQFNQELMKENQLLKQKLEAATAVSGEAEPVEFSASDKKRTATLRDAVYNKNE